MKGSKPGRQVPNNEILGSPRSQNKMIKPEMQMSRTKQPGTAPGCGAFGAIMSYEAQHIGFVAACKPEVSLQPEFMSKCDRKFTRIPSKRSTSGATQTGRREGLTNDLVGFFQSPVAKSRWGAGVCGGQRMWKNQMDQVKVRRKSEEARGRRCAPQLSFMTPVWHTRKP